MTDLARRCLENLYRCVTMDKTIGEHLCNFHCPFYNACEDARFPLIHLEPVVRNLPRSERRDRILAAIPRCLDITHDACNEECPYWKDCEDDNITFLFRDLRDELRDAGYDVDTPHDESEFRLSEG